MNSCFPWYESARHQFFKKVTLNILCSSDFSTTSVQMVYEIFGFCFCYFIEKGKKGFFIRWKCLVPGFHGVHVILLHRIKKIAHSHRFHGRISYLILKYFSNLNLHTGTSCAIQSGRRMRERERQPRRGKKRKEKKRKKKKQRRKANLMRSTKLLSASNNINDNDGTMEKRNNNMCK